VQDTLLKGKYNAKKGGHGWSGSLLPEQALSSNSRITRKRKINK
jgi:hypothetical protein